MGSQPKGSLCMACADSGKDCSGKDFASMKPVKVYPDGVKAVKCIDFQHVKVSPRGKTA